VTSCAWFPSSLSSPAHVLTEVFLFLRAARSSSGVRIDSSSAVVSFWGWPRAIFCHRQSSRGNCVWHKLLGSARGYVITKLGEIRAGIQLNRSQPLTLAPLPLSPSAVKRLRISATHLRPRPYTYPRPSMSILSPLEVPDTRLGLRLDRCGRRAACLRLPRARPRDLL